MESLRQAAALAPADSDSRIALGLELERARNRDQAERELLDAVSVDAGFKVRWSLANYYLRRGDWDEVWRWLHAAVLAEPSQLPVAAALGWRANAEPQTILDRAIPDRPDANRRYFGYLADIQQLDAMRQAWPRFAASLVAMDTPIANQYLDRLIAAGHVDEAVVAWNLMCDKVLLPHAPLGAEEGRYLTNPYFLTAPSSHGFDWHPGNHRGVSWSRLPTTANRGALEFRLSGAQDSGITLLRQVMPAVSGEYQLSFQLATQGMPTRTGVGWTVREAYGERVIYEFAGLNNAEGFWDDGNVSFHVPSDVPAVILEFRYETAEFGVIRRGAVQLRNLELVRASSAGAPLR